MANSTRTATVPFRMGDAAAHLHRRVVHQFTSGHRFGGVPIWLGAPGIAKTARQTAAFVEAVEEVDPNASVLIHSTTLADVEVTEVRGVGIPSRPPEGTHFDRLIYTRSGLLPTPEECDEYDYVFIQIDELPASTMDHMKAVNPLLLDYRLGGVNLDPAKFFVAVTGNRVTDRSGALRLPAHTINRCALMEIEPDVQDWLLWATDPANHIPPLAQSFVSFRPGMFTESDPPAEANTPFATFRSLTLAVQDLQASFGDSIDLERSTEPGNLPVTTAILAAYLGKGVATEFSQFARVRTQLTPLKHILEDPEDAAVPEDTAAQFAQASYVVHWAATDEKAGKPKGIDAILTYLMRLRRDMRAPTLLSLRRRVPQVVSSAKFSQFAIENAGLFRAVMSAEK